jgi:hypothetical protein
MNSLSSRGRRNRSRITGALLGVALAAALVPAGAQAADNDGTGVSGLLTGGSLDVTAPADVDFGSHAVTGVSTTLDANLLNWSASDTRGTFLGWTVTADASDVQVDAATISGMTPAIIADAPTSVTGSGTLPTINAGPHTLTGGGAEILAADVDEGIGPFAVLQAGATDLHLALPYNARPGTYTSTITYTIAALA